MVREQFANPLKDFMKGIKYRIIPSLKSGEEKQIGTVEQIMRNLLNGSKNLTIDDIVAINKRMEDLPSTAVLNDLSTSSV